MGEESNKIFEDFPKVDCNECENYYTSACDGVSKDSERPCKTFIATRRIFIPEEIKWLKNEIKTLRADFQWLQKFTFRFAVIVLVFMAVVIFTN